MNTQAEIVIFGQSPALAMVGTIRPYPPYESYRVAQYTGKVD